MPYYALYSTAKDWEYIIYIHWTFSAMNNKMAPHVAFIAEQGWRNVIKAKEYYELKAS